MLEVAQPEARARTRSHSRKFTWGIVDVLLGVVMFPFGVWLLVIQGLVNAATWLFSLGSPQPRRN
jgi:hypothetical protein